MHRAAPLFEDYSHHHRTTGNEWCHRIGIPMIVPFLLGMLSFVRFPIGDLLVDAVMLLIALSAVYYFSFGWRIGHGVYEKRSPASLKSLVHLLVGPMWILNDLIPLVPDAKTGCERQTVAD